MRGLKSWLPGRLARSTALIITFSSLLFALLVWLLGRGLLIPSFEAAERRLAHDAAIQTRDIFVESAQGLSRFAADWANWDGSYHFVRNGQFAPLHEMFTPRRFTDIGIDFMAFFSIDGHMRLSVENTPQGIAYNSPALTKSLVPDSEFGRHLSQMLATTNPGPQAGVVRLPSGANYMILSPVRPSRGTGTPAGYMVWGVRADKILLRSKAAFFSSDTQILSVTSRHLPDAVMQWVAQGMPGGEVLVLPNEHRVASWIAVRNLDNKPALLLGRSTPREVSALAVSNINLLAALGVAGILVVGLIALYLLQVRVAGRLRRLSSVVGHIRGQGRVERLRPDGHDDEIAELALGINALIDDKNHMLQERDESEQRFAFVFANSMAGMLLLREGKVNEINASAVLMFHEKTPQQLLDRPLLEMLDIEDARSTLILALLDERAQAGDAKRCECRLRRADGSVFDCDVTATVLLQGDSKLLHLHLDDVTERKTILHRMHYMAFHDSLTGLVNRNLFHDRLAQTLRQQQRDGLYFAVLFIDLDGFKAVNDSLGHAAGDALLQTLALRMSACVRSNDTLSRLSGDEFALLMTGTAQPLAVIHLARRILAELSHPVQLAQGVARVTASIGVLLGHEGYTDAEQVLHDADIAMYRAKRGGKNRIVLYRPAQQTTTSAG
ncbi:diguanylate cyclase domain-containing protein [Craterilacuibacter sp.]|uniref:sensor domain-containing diguanylate cyclase n=1 Tax=Craterilacuibacter sp. TaxID=2870909 RepID=UPI003F392F7D